MYSAFYDLESKLMSLTKLKTKIDGYHATLDI